MLLLWVQSANAAVVMKALKAVKLSVRTLTHRALYTFVVQQGTLEFFEEQQRLDLCYPRVFGFYFFRVTVSGGGSDSRSARPSLLRHADEVPVPRHEAQPRGCWLAAAVARNTDQARGGGVHRTRAG